MKILCIATGGTIDKDYPHNTKGWAFEFGEPAVARILERWNPSFEYELLSPFQKDSLEMTDADREKLAELILGRDDSHVILTHGTDTMIDTAQYLGRRIKDRKIVITGAMRPERFSNSDAAANVGSAIGALNCKAVGVYIAMHGVVKPYDQIKRDLNTGKYD